MYLSSLDTEDASFEVSVARVVSALGAPLPRRRGELDLGGVVDVDPDDGEPGGRAVQQRDPALVVVPFLGARLVQLDREDLGVVVVVVIGDDVHADLSGLVILATVAAPHSRLLLAWHKIRRQ